MGDVLNEQCDYPSIEDLDNVAATVPPHQIEIVVPDLAKEPTRTRCGCLTTETTTWSPLNSAISGLLNPILEGHIWKDVHQHNKNMMGTFRKRYCVLFDGLLIYYHHKSSYEKDKKNGLKKAHVVVLDGLHLSKPDSDTAHGARLAFVLHVPHESNKRNHILIALSSRKSRNIWLEMLQMQNPNLKPHDETDSHHHRHPVPYYIQTIRDSQASLSYLRRHSEPETQRDSISLSKRFASRALSLPENQRGMYDCHTPCTSSDKKCSISSEESLSEGLITKEISIIISPAGLSPSLRQHKVTTV